MEISGLYQGDKIDVSLGDGYQKQFDVFIGDAFLNGNEDQIWLKSNNDDKTVYLRKLPQEPLSIGVAIFNSLQELENTLNSGRFYVA